jgi:hypothetical protein
MFGEGAKDRGVCVNEKRKPGGELGVRTDESGSAEEEGEEVQRVLGEMLEKVERAKA